MTGSDDFPLPELPSADLPSRGFEQAWQQGRRRRRRSLLASGGSSAVLGAAVLLALVALPGTSDRDDSLQQLGPAGTGEVPSRIAPPTAGPLPSTLGPGGLPKLPKLPKLPGLPRTSPSATATPAPGPHAPEERHREGYAGSPSRAVEREYVSSTPRADTEGIGVDGGGQTVCGVDAADRPSGEQARWCGSNEVSDAEGDLLLRHSQCRAHDADQEALTFLTTQEVEYEIRSASGELLWRWSDGVVLRDDPHALSSERGACYRWVTVWSPLDAAGQDLPGGEYTLRTWVTSAELGPDAPYDTDFRIEPTGEDAT